MRWEDLFEDLEGQLRAQELRELESEVADRTRRERSLVGLHDLLLGNLGRTVELRLASGRSVEGPIGDVGAGWVLVTDLGRPTIVAFPAILAVRGLARRVEEPGAVARRFGIGMALRAVSRDRATVDVVDLTGAILTGTIDGVGADHIDLAAHPADVPRRQAQVLDRWVIPFTGIGVVRRHHA